MSTPIFDALHADWSDVIASAEARATLELKSKIVEVLSQVKRPTVAMKQLLEECTDGND